MTRTTVDKFKKKSQKKTAKTSVESKKTAPKTVQASASIKAAVAKSSPQSTGPLCSATRADGKKCATSIAKQGPAMLAGLCGPHWYATQPRRAADKKPAQYGKKSPSHAGPGPSAEANDKLRWLLWGEKRGYVKTEDALEQIRAELGQP